MARTKTARYFGRRAEVTTNTETGVRGQREIITHWLDDADPRNGGYKAGTWTSKTVSGDFAKGTGVVHVETHVIAYPA
jgi:hypothetical protein